MGSRHVDNIPISVAWPGCAGVGEMRRRDWKVIAKCRQCGLQLHVNLGMIERCNGPDCTLWNRNAPCRRVGCMGRVDFWAIPPGGSLFRQLAVDRREPVP